MADATGEKPPSKSRRPKQDVSPDEVADQRARSQWTRDKLDLLQAALHDPRINAKRFRLFAYVLQCTNYKSRIAIVHDQQIMDEVPGFGDDESIRRNRKAIREIGWWDFTPGRGIRSTIYTPSADPIKGVMSLIRIMAEDRRAAHAYRKEALRTGKETLEEQHQAINEMRGKPIRRSPQNAGKTSYENEGISPSLTPSGRGEESVGRSQDIAQGLGRPEVVTSPECVDCGANAVVEQRDSPGGKFWSLCQEHRSCAAGIEERPIPSNGNSRASEDDAYRASSRG